MHAWYVNIDALSDDELRIHGWILEHNGEEFSVYWNPRYNEYQVIQNSSPRYILVDDYNDAVSLSRGKAITPIE